MEWPRAQPLALSDPSRLKCFWELYTRCSSNRWLRIHPASDEDAYTLSPYTNCNIVCLHLSDAGWLSLTFFKLPRIILLSSDSHKSCFRLDRLDHRSCSAAAKFHAWPRINHQAWADACLCMGSHDAYRYVSYIQCTCAWIHYLLVYYCIMFSPLSVSLVVTNCLCSHRFLF